MQPSGTSVTKEKQKKKKNKPKNRTEAPFAGFPYLKKPSAKNIPKIRFAEPSVGDNGISISMAEVSYATGEKGPLRWLGPVQCIPFDYEPKAHVNPDGTVGRKQYRIALSFDGITKAVMETRPDKDGNPIKDTNGTIILFPKFVQELDKQGSPKLDEKGQPILIPEIEKTAIGHHLDFCEEIDKQALQTLAENPSWIALKGSFTPDDLIRFSKYGHKGNGVVHRDPDGKHSPFVGANLVVDRENNDAVLTHVYDAAGQPFSLEELRRGCKGKALLRLLGMSFSGSNAFPIICVDELAVVPNRAANGPSITQDDDEDPDFAAACRLAQDRVKEAQRKKEAEEKEVKEKNSSTNKVASSTAENNTQASGTSGTAGTSEGSNGSNTQNPPNTSNAPNTQNAPNASNPPPTSVANDQQDVPMQNAESTDTTPANRKRNAEEELEDIVDLDAVVNDDEEPISEVRRNKPSTSAPPTKRPKKV